MKISSFFARSASAVLSFCIGILSVGFFTQESDLGRLGPSESQIEQEVLDAPVSNPLINRFSGAGVQTEEEVERFWKQFQLAVAADDKKTVASMAIYPFRVNYANDPLSKNYRFIKNQGELIRVYDKVFDAALKGRISKTSEKDMWGNYHGIATPRGEIWIGVYCTRSKNDCSSGYYLRLSTIHSNSGFIDRPTARSR